ncbi:MAG: RNA polymerase sigma factor [Polyangiaceae bacterium]
MIGIARLSVLWPRIMSSEGATEIERVETYDASPARLRDIVKIHYAFLWRSLRRNGIPESSVEDVAQKVLLVVSRRLSEIRPGAEKAFLYRTAVNAAMTERRTHARRREDYSENQLDFVQSSKPDPSVELAKQEARKRLDDVLEAMDPDLRSIFVLYELEEMTMADIAAMLEIPAGTVASRLRRAREEFQTLAKRMTKGDER